VNRLSDGVFGALLGGDFDGPCFVVHIDSLNTIDAFGGVPDALKWTHGGFRLADDPRRLGRDRFASGVPDSLDGHRRTRAERRELLVPAMAARPGYAF
jgi:hypothetical protein